MLSIAILSCLVLLSLIFIKITKQTFFKVTGLIFFNFLIVEICVFLFLFSLIMKGDCFFLIGNQKFMDVLIKTRIIYATYYAQGKKGFIYRVDPDTGYTVGTNKETSMYKTNRQGFRGDREYSQLPSSNKLRIAAFGDSFVFCDDEKNQDTWEHYLEGSAKNLEVLNFGVSGYGLGQSYLRFLRYGLQYAPDIISFNYIVTGNRDHVDAYDIISNPNIRVAHIYRAYFNLENGFLLNDSVAPYELFDADFRRKEVYAPLGLKENDKIWASKFFSISNTGLLIKYLFYKKFLLAKVDRIQYDDIDVNVAILTNIIELSKHQHAMVLFFVPFKFSDLPAKIQDLLQANQENVIFVNSDSALNTVYEKHHITENLRNKTNHYNPRGNQLYAETVLEILKSRQWGKADRVFVYEDNSQSFKNISKSK